MIRFNSDTFNQYTKLNMDGTKSRGESTDFLTINLFKSYQVASNANFVRYIKVTKKLHDFGKNMLADQLMMLAWNKVNMLNKSEKCNSMSSK